MLVYDEKVSRHFWRISVVAEVSPSRSFDTKRRIKKANAILKCPVNKLFSIEFSFHDTDQTDKANE